jgi:hypothetical protein
MSRFRVLAVAAAALGAVLCFVLFRGSEEARVRETLERFAAIVRVKPDDNVLARAGRLRSGFKELVTDDVHVDVPDLSMRLSSRDDLAAGATSAAAAYGSADATLTSVRIRIDESETTATADALVIVDGVRGGERRVDRRDVHFLLRNDGGWRIAAIDVASDGH